MRQHQAALGEKLFSGAAGRCPSSRFLLRVPLLTCLFSDQIGKQVFQLQQTSLRYLWSILSMWRGDFLFFLFKMWLLFGIQQHSLRGCWCAWCWANTGAGGVGGWGPLARLTRGSGSSRKWCPEWGTQRGVQWTAWGYKMPASLNWLLKMKLASCVHGKEGACWEEKGGGRAPCSSFCSQYS